MHPLTLAGLAFATIAAPSMIVPGQEHGAEMAQLVLRSHIVVRIQTGPVVAPSAAPQFREKKGPPCIALGQMAGAAILSPRSVDIALRSGERVRARFTASCPALDYYSGFYIAPTADGKLCAGRDAVRDRAGGECPVERLRLLVPRKPPRP